MNAVCFEAVEFDPFADAADDAAGALERVWPTSEAQREVWLADRLGTGASLAFNEAVTLRLRGVLNLNALREALAALVQRHEALRATVGPDGTELLIGTRPAIDLAVYDHRGLSADEQSAALDAAGVKTVSTPFSLEQGPLLRMALHRLAGDHHVLLLTAHHIVCDGWSWAVIADDLGALYAQHLGAGPGPKAADAWADYVAWEAQEAASPEMAAHLQYWLSRFEGGGLPALDLPLDRPRAPVRSFTAARIDRTIDAALIADVRRIGAKAGASAFAALFAAFAATLHRITRQDDIVIGVPSAGQSASGMHALVGHCVNLLPVRTAIDAKQPFDAFVARCGSELLDAFDHQTLTYGSLLKRLPIARDPSRLPLVSVMFNVDQAVKSQIDSFPGLQGELAGMPRTYENFELFVNAAQVDEGLRLECQYNTDLFDGASVERWLAAYEALLRSVVRAPSTPVGALAIIGDAQQHELRALQPAATPVASTLMHELVEQQAQATPERNALRCDDLMLSYRELDEHANQLAHMLRERGVERGHRVGLCLSRGIDMVVALLGVLKAGATYVPLDPGFPKARLDYFAEDAQLVLLLTEKAIDVAPTAWCADAAQRVLVIDADTAWTREPVSALSDSAQRARPDDVAYVIYTSGSTGKPKGVAVPHGAVANFLESMRREPGLKADDRLAAVTTLSFDIAVLELLLPLTVGAEVVIVPRDTAMDGAALRGLLERSHATAMQATPGMWRILLDTPWEGGAGFKALVGGESLPPDLARALLDRCGEVWNLYGPTETTIWSTAWRLDRVALAARGMSIGKPIANTSVWIVDDAGQPCPIGVPGEIWIGGAGVALGYLDRPELTTERFVPGRFAGDANARRIYRTGDLGRWRNDGLLEHLGRLDFQVKVRGYRIELGEIEAACNEVPGVSASVLVAREDNPGDVRLVAYIARSAQPAFDEAVLRTHLKAKLPVYMLPQHVVALDRLPLLPNGKVDRKSLPAPQAADVLPTTARVAPRNPIEAAVLAAMEAVLKLPALSVHDDFFALGGHSLLAAQFTSRLNRELDLQLPLRTLFEAPTAERLAQAVAKAQASSAGRREPIRHEPHRLQAPLTPMQERIRFIEQLHPGRVLYNTPSAHRLIGPFDAAAFERAFRDMVQRQPALRTQIVMAADGSGSMQQILPELDIALPVEDLSSWPESDREAELMRRMQAIVDQPIDIAQAPLFRAALYRLDDLHHAFLFMPHHIIWDGWSFDVLYEEMSAAYSAATEGRANPLPALAVDYGDYAQWLAGWMDSDEFTRQLGYWKQRFAKAAMPKALKSDRPRRAGQSGEGAAEWVRVDKATTERLRQVARDAGVTLNMLTMAVYATMMAGVLGGNSVVIGVPVRGRLAAELEPVMGFFNNLLPVQVDLRAEQSLIEFAGALKADLLEVFSHQEVPFERLATEPEVAARTQKVGLYQALFSFQDARERRRQWGALSHQSILIFQKGATEDLGLWLMEVPHGLEGGVTYNADIYTAETAAAFRERYMELLRRVADLPSATIAELTTMNGSLAAHHLSRLTPGDEDIRPSAAAAEPGARGRAVDESVLSPEELAVARLWAPLLGLEPGQIRAGDRFAAIGGDAALAQQAAEATERAFGFRLDAQRYLQHTPAQIAMAAAVLGEVMPAHVAPAGNATEQAFARIWASLLNIDAHSVTPQDNFFDLGGNSLLAMRAAGEMSKQIGANFNARRLIFESLSQLANTSPEETPAEADIDDAPKRGLFGRIKGVFGR
jgi:amino acid adenylation domain-containing protein